MVRTKNEEGTGVEEMVIEKTETKNRLSSCRTKEKTHTQSLIVDKTSFGIGFTVGSFLLCMFIIGCIIGSTVI